MADEGDESNLANGDSQSPSPLSCHEKSDNDEDDDNSRFGEINAENNKTPGFS